MGILKLLKTFDYISPAIAALKDAAGEEVEVMTEKEWREAGCPKPPGTYECNGHYVVPTGRKR